MWIGFATRTAIWAGRLERVKARLRDGADPNAVFGSPSTWGDFEAPNHLAARLGHAEVVQALIAAGADVNEGEPLYAAIREGHTAIACALIIAARKGHADVVEALIQAGADRSATEGEGKTALDWARQNNHTRIVELLQQESAAAPKATKNTASLAAAERQRAGVMAKPIPEQGKTSGTGRHAQFKKLVDELAAMCGVKPYPTASGGVYFDLAPGASVNVEVLQQKFLRKGCFVFACQGRLIALPTNDKYEAVIAMQLHTHNKGPCAIIRWLKRLEKDQPFILTSATADSLAIHFTTPINDPEGLATRMYEFCPDLDSVEAVAERLRAGREIVFWWD